MTLLRGEQACGNALPFASRDPVLREQRSTATSARNQDHLRVDEEAFACDPRAADAARRREAAAHWQPRIGHLIGGAAGETIYKDQLIARTWPDTVVDGATLRVHVFAA